MFDGHIGHTNLVTHKIGTGNSPPIRQSPRRISPHLTEQVKAELDKLVQQGILEESEGSWASPICLVRKKTGELRVCADMRKLNSVTRLPAYLIPRIDEYPIPRIDDTLDALSASSVFCKLDMNSAYHQISIDPIDREKATIGNHPFRELEIYSNVFGAEFRPLHVLQALEHRTRRHAE